MGTGGVGVDPPPIQTTTLHPTLEFSFFVHLDIWVLFVPMYMILLQVQKLNNTFTPAY